MNAHVKVGPTSMKLSQLKHGHEYPGVSLNARSTDREQDLEALMASIKAEGGSLMPKTPDDMDMARARDGRERQARADQERRRQESLAHDEAVIRDMANELRRRQGLPPLRPDEPVEAIICSRGRR